MLIYNKEDKNITIPNGIGNLNLVVNQENDLSNYATTQYVDEEILKVNNEIETINEDIDVLEGRIMDLENNGGSSEGGKPEIIFYYESDIDENKISLFYNNWQDIINNFTTEVLLVIVTPAKKVLITNVHYEDNFREDYIIGTDGLYQYKFTRNRTNVINCESTSYAVGDFQNLQDEITANTTRISNLENNVLVVSVFNYTNLNNAVTVFKNGGNVIFKNVDSNYPEINVQMSGEVLNASTMKYTISAFSFEKLYYFEIPISSTTNDFYPVKSKTLKYE